jgi:hypothetical protein
VPESAPSGQPDDKKRRSTRIVQAVPLTITGVDALGRPFQERTSTLVINCHGCRYQSKHYVLKNMWVALEVPHPESGREARTVRAKIVWIQRPRTVRELFHVGVELEAPGNFWGIAFPPGDWFPFAEIAVSPLPSLAAQTEAEAPFEEGILPGVDENESNVRVLPGPGSAEASLALARQVARLVVEAKQQIQTAVREATTRAVAAEVRPMLAAIHSQLSEAAEKSVQAAAVAHTEEMLRQAAARIEEARQAAGSAAREEWSRELERRAEEARTQLAAQLAQAAEAQRVAFVQRLETHISRALENLRIFSGEIGAKLENTEVRVKSFQQQVEESAEATRRRWQEMAEGRAEEARARLEALEEVSKRLNREIDVIATAAETGWRARLDADLAAASTRWNERIETSLEGAAQLAAERLARRSEGVTQKLEEEFGLRATAIRESLEQTAAEVRSTLSTLRAALDAETARAKASTAETQQAASRMEEYATRLDALGRATAEELQRRFEAILATESSELDRRAESAVAGMVERFQPVLEAAGQQSLAQLAAQLEQRLAPHMERANELAQKLTAGQQQAEENLRAHRERLQQASEQSVQEAVARLQGTLARFERDFQEAGRAATSQWLAELEERATDTTHTTYEALYKASQWYEKRIQTQMQTTLDKGIEQATNNLREKAGEISGLFASELDHYSRSYVEHTQGQMDEVVKDAVEGARSHLTQTAETTVATFSDDIHRAAQREFERLSGSAASLSEQTVAQLEAHAVQLRTKTDAEARRFFVEFHKGMTQEIQQGVAQARQELEAQVAPVKEAWNAEREAQERQLQETLTGLGEGAMEDYKKRLENASNSWLVATVTALTQQSQDVIAALAGSTERRLRETCSQVFADFGEALRKGLLELSNLSPQQEKK